MYNTLLFKEAYKKCHNKCLNSQDKESLLSDVFTIFNSSSKQSKCLTSDYVVEYRLILFSLMPTFALLNDPCKSSYQLHLQVL